jgi:hypothetical protein
VRERNGSRLSRRLRALLVPAASARDYVSSAQAFGRVGAKGTTRLPDSATFYGGASLAGIEPVGFRVKSDLRNHQAIVQPRLYADSLMVTQITLNTEVQTTEVLK